MRQLITKDRDLQAIVSADEGVDYGRVMRLVDLVKSLGVGEVRAQHRTQTLTARRMSRRADIITAAVAIVVHGAGALAIARRDPAPHAPRPRPVEVEFRRPPAPPTAASAAARAGTAGRPPSHRPSGRDEQRAPPAGARGAGPADGG